MHPPTEQFQSETPSLGGMEGLPAVLPSASSNTCGISLGVELQKKQKNTLPDFVTNSG